MNTKKKYKKKEKTKRRAYQCPPPFIMEYPSANRAYTVCLYYCPTSSISAIFRPKTMHVHNTRISYVNKSVSFAGFSGFVCIINNQILRRHAAILVCPVQGKQCGHLKFSENVCTKNYQQGYIHAQQGQWEDRFSPLDIIVKKNSCP